MASGAMDEASEPVWQGPDAARLYPLYLAELHGVATGAVPLMQRAIERCRELSDPVAAPLGAYLEHHLPEERGHDQWLLDDIAALGGDPDEVRRRMPSPAAASANGAQVWWIDHGHPVCFLGHAEVMEGWPADPAVLDEFQQRTGLPDDGLRFFRRHALIDLRHRDEINALLDSLPLTDELQSLIGVSALNTVAALTNLYRSVR
jgi:heme oxygenase-like protein